MPHRDLVFALVAESRRRDLVRRPTTEAAEARRAEVFDLAGVGARSPGRRRGRRADRAARHRCTTSRSPPTATGAARRTGSAIVRQASSASSRSSRDLEVEQVILVSAAPESPGPHALAAPRLDGRGRLGEYLQSSEAAAVRDAHGRRRGGDPRSVHHPAGAQSRRSVRFRGRIRRSIRPASELTELMSRGYEDAYHQFIEPVVGASGDRVGSACRSDEARSQELRSQKLQARSLKLKPEPEAYVTHH